MYHNFFGMKQRPFGATPQIGSYYAAACQEEAIATLRYAITQGRGVGLLTGSAGTGKTLVCHRLTSSLESAYTTAMITNTNMTSIKALHQSILYDLSLPYHGLEEQELRLSLTDFLLAKYADGGRTVLVVDEAQNLSIPLLEELRMLGNLEGEADKVCQVLLVGHHRLLNVLRQPELETLNQRVGARAALRALSDEESVAYIRHQLQCAGVFPEEVFTYDGMTAVFEASGGVPRLINQFCEHALLLAYVAEARRVDADLVERACADLNRLVNPESEETPATDAPRFKSVAFRAPADRESESEIAKCAERESCTLPDTHETQEACLQIITEDCVPDCQSAPDCVTASATISVSGQPDPIDEAFAQEEIVVDSYALMDAARSGFAPAPLSILRNLPTRSSEPSVEQPETNDSAARVQEWPMVALKADEPRETSIRPCPQADAPAEVSFVDSSDNPAVHEVGADIVPEVAESADLPILVIESRSQRVAGNLGRVDLPQQKTEGGMRAYRRLFSHARKND